MLAFNDYLFLFMHHLATRHPFHLVTCSPWPLFSSISTFGLVVAIAGFMNDSPYSLLLGCITFFSITLSASLWWRDVLREATFEGAHCYKVQVGLRLGMGLFIVSEVMFFFSFFWTFFHSSVGPSQEIGQQWPPTCLTVLCPWTIPLLNTVLLLFSGVTVTACHHAVLLGHKKSAAWYLFYTLTLAVLFLCLQAFEYQTSLFNFSDSVYGSVFYIATGFHGLHVLIGSVFLAVCLARVFADHLSRTHHVGFESAAWYWHMVDVVWLFLFVVVYYLYGR